jgi:hypothetical protein
MTFCVGFARGQQFERSRIPCKRALSSSRVYVPVCGVRFRPGAMQTHKPTAPTKKTCKRGPLEKRLKGFEPSTFCMASRRWGGLLAADFPANRVLPRRAQADDSCRLLLRNHGGFRTETGLNPERAGGMQRPLPYSLSKTRKSAGA